MGGGLSYAVLGPFVVERDGREVALGGPRQRAVLARLLLEPNVVVPRDRLIQDLWGDDPSDRSAATLRAYLSHLRRALGAAVVVSRRPGYVIDVDPEAVDSTRFQRLATDGARRLEDGDALGASAALRAALDLWRGDVLADLDPELSVHPTAVRLAERRHTAVEDWVDAELALGHHALMAAELESLVAEAPLRERRRGQLMLALYRCGRQAEALRAFQVARTQLLDELGIEPGSALRDLEEAILLQKSTLDWEPRAPRGLVLDPPRRVSAPARFVGRQRELDTIASAMRAASGGTGSIVLVSGEGGIGKTTLAEEAARSASGDGWRVVVSRAVEDGGAPPLWLWSQVLGDLVPEWDDALLASTAGAVEAPGALGSTGASGRLRQYDAVTRILLAEAQASPLLILLDDVHWADAGSLLLLEYVAQAVAGARILVLGTFREIEARADPTTADAIAAVARAASTSVLALGGLSEPEVASYLAFAGDSRSDLASEVWRRTDGNPYFVSEVARVLEGGGALETVPLGVHAHLRQRLAQLSETAQEALVAAAVLGSPLLVPVVAGVAGLQPTAVLEALDEAGRTGLVRRDSALGAWRFGHALVREALYDRLPAPMRVDLHARAARVLEARGDSDRITAIAHHRFCAAEAGGNAAEQAVAALEAAAAEAVSRLAWEDAASWNEKVIQVLELIGAGPDRRAAAQLGLARARGRAGDLPRARAAALAAGEGGRAIGDAMLLGEAALAYGVGGVITGTVDWTLVRLLEEALGALGDGDPDLRARLLARTGMELYYAPEQGGGLALAGEGVEVARSLPRRQTLGECLQAFHFTLRRPSALEQRLAVGDELLALALSLNDAELELAARHGRVADLLEAGLILAVDRELAAYERTAERLRQPMYLFQSRVWTVMRALFSGRFDEAQGLMFDAFAMGQAVHSDAATQFLGVQMATLYREQGRLAELIDSIRDFANEYSAAPAWRCALVYFLCELGREDEAAAELNRLAAHDFADLPDDVNWLTAHALLASTCAYLHEPRLARLLHDQLMPYADRNVVVAGVAATSSYGAAAHYLGYLAEAMGDVSLALAHFNDGLRLNRAWRARPWAAQSAYEIARLSGDSELRAWARAEAVTMNMPRLITRIDALVAES